MNLKGELVHCSADFGVLMPERKGKTPVLLEMFGAGEG